MKSEKNSLGPRGKAAQARAGNRLFSILIVAMLIAASFALIHASENAQALDFVETMTVPWPSTFEPLDSEWDSTGNHAIVVGSDTGQSSNAWHYNSASGEWAQVIPAVLPPVILYVGSGTGNYSTTIQAAIDAASAGDTVYVWPGIYYENVVIGKPINLRGHNRATTIIDGSGVGNVITVNYGQVTISNLTIQAAGSFNACVALSSADNTEISDLDIYDSYYGISPTYSNNLLINGCNIYPSTDIGIIFQAYCNNSVIHHNDIYASQTGIGFYMSHDNLVHNNTLSGATLYGVNIEASSGNVHWDNVISSNGYGVWIDSHIDNEFFHNDFINNLNGHVEDTTSSNIWNKALPVGGNYWDDYAGSDSNADGIGDTPHVFPGGQDNFPWTLQNGWNIDDITLSGEWHFDEGTGGIAYDSSHNSYDGALMPMYPTNNPTWTPSSVSGGCLYFDGIDDAVETNYISNTFNAHDFTIQAWIYPMANGSYLVVYGIGAANVQDQVIEFKVNGGRVEMWYWMDNWASNVFVNTNEWTHLTYTHSTPTKTGTIYVNGVYRDSHVFIANPNVYSDNYLPSQIGHGVENRCFKGYIDEFKIWARTLSPEEIQQQYDDMTTILIHNVTELQAMNNDLGANYALANDIDASGTVSWNGGAGFTPIGLTFANSFTGIFDGRNHTISGLHINTNTLDNAGLFGVITYGGTVKNLGLVDNIIIGKNYVGGIAGYSYQAVFSNVYATGTVTGNYYVGGLVGWEDEGTMTDCHSMGITTGNYGVGGISGIDGGSLTKCSATGSTIGNDYVGGLVGTNEIYGTTLINCYATGDVSGNTYVGGLVGSNTKSISNCYATGNVRGNNYVGGFAGSNNPSDMIDNCYSTGSVTRKSGSLDTYIGGFIGQNGRGKVNYCYSTGRVTYEGATDPTNKGFAGNITTGIGYEMIGNFWDTQTSLQTTTSGIASGQTTAAMMTQTTFTGWDFTNMWWMSSGNTRPFLRAEWSTNVRNSHQVQLISMNLGASYTLGCDIDLSDVKQSSQMWGTNTSVGKGFWRIGASSGSSFTGTLQGSGHRLSYLYINSSATSYVGLFGYIGATGKVYNITLANVYVVGSLSVGGLVGGNNGLVQGISVSGTVIGHNFNIGGVVGYNLVAGAVISRCSSSANVTSLANNAGGIVGYCLGTVSESFGTGTINALNYAGGLGAYMNSAILTDCYAWGSVSANNNAGGLVAFTTSGSITNCYSTGTVTCPTNRGGLIGANSGTPVTSSFWDTETSGLATSAGGTGKTTAQMKTQTTFTSTGWDFADTWHMLEEETYPLFTWQPLPLESTVHYGLNSVTWDEVGKRFWLCGETGGDSTVYYIDPEQSLTTSIPVSGAPSAPLRSIATDNLGNVLVGGTSGDTLYYYDAGNWNEIYSEDPVGFEALAMDFNPNDGRFYLAGYEDSPAVMAFYYTDPVPLIGGGTFHRYEAPSLVADTYMRSIAWNDLHDYGIAVGGDGQAVKVWPYSYYGNGTMHYENITSPITNDYYDISWDTDNWNEAAIVGQNQTYGNYWRYYNSNPKLIQGYKASLSGTLYRTCAFKPPSSPKWVMIPFSSGGVKINVEEKYEGGEIIITLGSLEIYSTKMFMTYDLAQADLFNMPVDAGSTYTFEMTCNYSGNWNNAVINLTAWHDRGALGDTSQPMDWNANNRTKQLNITYSPATNTTTMHYPIPNNGVSEFTVQSGWYESGTGIDGNWYKVYISVNFGPQTTVATGAMNPAVDIHDMNQALNDLNTWDVSMQLTDITDPASFDMAYNEFGVKKYAWISNSGTPKGSAPPGATNVHLSSSFINYSTNSNHSVTISIPNLYLNGYLGSPYSITVDRLAIQNLAGTVAYSDTADMPHPFPGPNLPMYIWGKSAGPVLISAPQNGTSSAGPVTNYTGGGTVYTVIDWWLTAVPVSVQEGMYMGTITITLGY